ncbi:hypothetical protein [Nostoc sp.]|uniref:hypothetical protein n=1 Tax=Nostoc sp. TaxID=1180 RepID=UPI002FFCA1E3
MCLFRYVAAVTSKRNRTPQTQRYRWRIFAINAIVRDPIQPYETLITTREQLCFGNAEILADNYEQCQQAYEEISQG